MAKKMLHPGARWSFRVGYLWSIIFLIIFLGFFILSVALPLSEKAGFRVFYKILSIFLAIFVILIIIGEVWTRMYYNRFFYEFTDTNLKLERGVIWKKYSNVPYDRVQNVDIHRGIIARMLGFSSVNIQTAGYSMPANGRGLNTEGYIPAVNIDEAEKIRDFLMKKISKKHNQGL